jgi:DNA-binding transcriptional regulator YiaG
MQKDNHTPHINVDFFEDLTGNILKASGKGVEAIGERVKRLREEKGLTLDELSNLTGFEVEFLKRIENNEVKASGQTSTGNHHEIVKSVGQCFWASGFRRWQ